MDKIFTVAEVAQVLRVSPETIRRKIVAQELPALEIGHGLRKQYRIAFKDLVTWLGLETAYYLFGIDEKVNMLIHAYAQLPEVEAEALLNEALQWARQHAPTYIPAPDVLENVELPKKKRNIGRGLLKDAAKLLGIKSRHER